MVSQYKAVDDSCVSSICRLNLHNRIFDLQSMTLVAVTGLPVPRDDHVIVMCRFARDILTTMQTVTKQLEVTLGPDTGRSILQSYEYRLPTHMAYSPLLFDHIQATLVLGWASIAVL